MYIRYYGAWVEGICTAFVAGTVCISPSIKIRTDTPHTPHHVGEVKGCLIALVHRLVQALFSLQRPSCRQVEFELE